MNIGVVHGPLHGLAWPSRRLVLPVLLAGWLQVDVWVPTFGNQVGPRAAVTVLYAVTALALIWRQSAPLAVLTFIVTIQAAEYLAFGAPEALGVLLPTLLAFYSVGRYAPLGGVALAAPLVLLGTAVHDLRDPAFTLNGSTAFFWLVLATAWPLGQAFQRRANEADTLASRARQLAADLEASARAAAEAERARIARELHDVVGHGLSVIVLQLVAALGILDTNNPGRVRERLLGIERTARDSLAEMRRLLDLLDDGADASLAPQPGLEQLDQLLADTRAAGAKLDLTITGKPLELPAGVDLAGYRILQESLTNVLKHARPPRAHVRVAYEPDAVVIDVRDEGRSGDDAGSAGRGLTGMRERVMLYRGELDVGRAPDGGFHVRARLPVPG